MGLILSRVRSDPYYASYEKRFEKLDSECTRLQVEKSKLQRITNSITGYYVLVAASLTVFAAVHAAWVYRQPAGTFDWDEHLLRTSPVVILPLLLWFGHEALFSFFKWKASILQTRLTRLTERKRKLVKEVKDMSRYDKVSEFLKKWDPDAPPPTPVQPVAVAVPGAMQVGNRVNSTPELLYRLTGGAAQVAVGAAAGAGKSLLPLLDKVAQNVVGDNPTLVHDIRRLQAQLHAAEGRAAQLAAENRALKQHNAALRANLQHSDMPLVYPLSPSHTADSELSLTGLVPSVGPAGSVTSSQSGEVTDVTPSTILPPLAVPTASREDTGSGVSTPRLALPLRPNLAVGSSERGPGEVHEGGIISADGGLEPVGEDGSMWTCGSHAGRVGVRESLSPEAAAS